ncbi:MAG TPA: YIP1 family protein [Blastocatellia bacterium]
MDEPFPPVDAYGESQPGAQAPVYGLPTARIAQPEEPARIGPAGRLIGVLVSPGETFADINRKPTWLVPILVSIVVGIASGWFFNWWARPNYDRILRKQIQTRSEKMNTPMPSEEVLTRQVDFGKTIAKYGAFAFPVIVIPLFALFMAGIFALEMLAIQGKTTYKKLLSVYAWTSCSVGLVNAILLVAVMMVRDRESLSELTYQDLLNISPTNLGVFLQSSNSGVLKALTGSIDIISIWIIILLAIGLAAVGGNKKITKGKAAVVVIIPWCVWILIKIGFASLGWI